MNKFLTASFWFQLNPELSNFFVNSLFAVALAFLLVAIYGYLRQKEKTVLRNAWKSLFSFGFVNFVIFIMWWVFAFERIPLLSTRFWFVAFAAMDIFWLYLVNKKFRKKAVYDPELEAKKINKRYIP